MMRFTTVQQHIPPHPSTAVQQHIPEQWYNSTILNNTLSSLVTLHGPSATRMVVSRQSEKKR